MTWLRYSPRTQNAQESSHGSAGSKTFRHMALQKKESYGERMGMSLSYVS
jgi:hypothetical protein